MCGILGSINVSNTNDYLNYIKHRGPDGCGAKSFMVNANEISLLHRRLSIVDLTEAGKQPMLSHNTHSCITFNGEIYNHSELKKSLSNIQFQGHSDTETIVNYFSEFGIAESLKKLNGIFSLAYLDLKNQQLHLARDRFGVKPLYYSFDNDQLFFSSELKPLKAFLNPEINEEAVMSSLRIRYSPSPTTIYKNIFKVEPGQLLTFHLKPNLQLTKTYYVPTPNALGTIKDDYRNLVKKYGDLFEKAVERQLMSDVEVGILLSGGVDSALLAAVAKQKSKSPIKAFTVGFEGKHDDVDEINYARDTAATLGLVHYDRRISITDFFDSVNRISRIVEEPIGTTSIIPMYFLSELAASEVKVVLSGQGADEPLGGYNKYRALPLLEESRRFGSLMSLTKSAEFFYKGKEKLRRLFSSMQTADTIDALVEFNAISSVQELTELITPANRGAYIEGYQRQQELFKGIWKNRTPKNSGIKNLFLYYDLRTSLSDDLLMYTDKISMHFSLECRVPILDNDLVDFIESIDSRYKYNSSRGKIIHKDFAKEYLPASIVERKKLGFQSPTESWFKNNKRELEELLTSNSEFNTLFNADTIRKILQQHFNGRNMEKQIFLLLSIFYITKKKSSVSVMAEA